MKKPSGKMLLLATIALGASQCAFGDVSSAIKEIDAFAQKGQRSEACKAIGDTANEFGDLEYDQPAVYEELLKKLDVKFQSNGCAEKIKAIIPKESAVTRNDTIRWIESLPSHERDLMRNAARGEVNNATRVVTRVVTATIQMGDREGEGRRAERMRELRERDAANREVARERREREREVIASPVDSPVTNAIDLDY